jgi:nucleoside-diphosphate-sugar epimerase
MRALIVGGTGFIGPWVVRGLCEAGCQVTVFHRGEHGATFPEEVQEVLHPAAGMPILDFPTKVLETRPEIVVHMIAMGEADARAAVQAFAGRAKRFVVLSSGDVYRAYGRFTGIEPGPIMTGLLTEDSPLRSVFYPYRAQAKSNDDLAYYYEKILVEDQFLRRAADTPATVLRLPKVYGAGRNADLQTVYANRNYPNWRWTHGYVENVATAIVLAALHPAAGGGVYNVGEEYTPTVKERLAQLPASVIEPKVDERHNFEQDIAYNTGRIRDELGYKEPITYDEGIRRTLGALSQPC